MKKKILITCDTEALDFPIFDKSPEINIFGRISNSEEYGIQKIIDTVDKINKKVLFFYDISTEYSYPGISSRVKDLIITAGHDLEMHAHLEHLSDEIWKKKGYKRPTFAVNYFDDEASMKYLEPLVDLFTKEESSKKIFGFSVQKSGAIFISGLLISTWMFSIKPSSLRTEGPTWETELISARNSCNNNPDQELAKLRILPTTVEWFVSLKCTKLKI